MALGETGLGMHSEPRPAWTLISWSLPSNGGAAPGGTVWGDDFNEVKL